MYLKNSINVSCNKQRRDFYSMYSSALSGKIKKETNLVLFCFHY